MPLGALAGFGAVLVLAFGWRTVLHRRRTGRTGWLVPQTRAAWLGDGLFTLGAIAVIVASVLELADALAPVNVLDDSAVQVVGATLLVLGGVIALLAQVHLGAAWRAGIDLSRPDPLVREGLFRMVRNPFYLGIMQAAAGAMLMVPDAVAVLGWLALVAGCEIDVRLVEEPHLMATHQDDYPAYMAATGRFLPLVGRKLPS